MNESTARAERFERGSAPAPSYTWTVPQKPVSVRIPLPIVGQLEHDAVESFRSLSSRGSEIGGVLFGSVVPGDPMVVVVDSFEAIPCDYASGPLYRLSDAELAKLDRAVEQNKAGGLVTVGFFRSHTRKGLSLDADDLALFDSRFKDPHQFALVIRPFAAKASTGGIFIRENGTVQAESSYLEFPFRVSSLDGSQPKERTETEGIAGPRSSVLSPSAPKPAARAQIVPIASRREITPVPPPIEESMPVAAAPPAPAVTPKAEVKLEAPKPEPPKVEAPKPEAPKAAKAEAAKPAKSAEPAPAAKAAKTAVEAPKPAAKTDAKAETKVAKAETKVAKAETEPEAKPEGRRSGKLLWIGLGAAVPLILIIGFFMSSGILHRGSAVPANQDTSALSLHVERNGGELLLTWNRDSDAIKRATRAVLEISDGTQHENVAMDLAQLRNGSIVYQPATSDVVFRMEVTGNDQAKTASESVRVLRTRPSPMPEESTGAQPPQQQAQQTPAKPAASGPSDSASNSEPAAPAVEEEKPTALAQAVKPFNAASLAQRLRTAPAPAATDSTVLPSTATPNSPAGELNLGRMLGSASAPAPTASAPAGTTAAPKTAAPQAGGQIVQAQLLKRKDPEYPKLARESGARGIVEVVATIGADGKVKSVKVLRGHPLLQQAATDAVKQWIYKPTLLNGVAVETQTNILLNFKSNQ